MTRETHSRSKSFRKHDRRNPWIGKCPDGHLVSSPQPKQSCPVAWCGKPLRSVCHSSCSNDIHRPDPTVVLI
jgi:hypothetical protein